MINNKQRSVTLRITTRVCVTLETTITVVRLTVQRNTIIAGLARIASSISLDTASAERITKSADLEFPVLVVADLLGRDRWIIGRNLGNIRARLFARVIVVVMIALVIVLGRIDRAGGAGGAISARRHIERVRTESQDILTSLISDMINDKRRERRDLQRYQRRRSRSMCACAVSGGKEEEISSSKICLCCYEHERLSKHTDREGTLIKAGLAHGSERTRMKIFARARTLISDNQ